MFFSLASGVPHQGFLDLRRARDLQQGGPDEARFQIPEEALLRVLRCEAGCQSGADFRLHFSARQECASATQTLGSLRVCLHISLRKSKGKMRRDLMTEYHNLGFPGRNRTMWEVIHQVEDKMSKNMDFIVGTSESGRQYVATKKASAWLPLLPKGKWAKDVLVDEMGIPIISDASGMKHKCISFFRGGEGGGSVEASSSALPVARAEVPALQASPPLPGMTANPGGAIHTHDRNPTKTLNF